MNDRSNQPDPAGDLRLCGATLADGTRADVIIRNGLISAVTAPAGTASDGAHTTATEPVDRREAPRDIDLTGFILLPAPVEPHAHLDKALLANRVRNDSEDLDGAIAAIITAYQTMTEEDLTRRCLDAIAIAVRRGYTAIRTHLDCRVGIGSRSVRTLQQLRSTLSGVIDLQIVALAGLVTDGDGPANRALLAESIDCGADLVGGTPSLDEDPARAVDYLLDIAADHGVGVDLHVDETTDAQMAMLAVLADRVTDRDFALPVTASHCVSLGVQDPVVVARTASAVARAGIGIVTLPQTNLYLQARDFPTARPRGLTAIGALRDAGVVVAGGGDNWRDPFNPMGRIDAMETASLLVTAGHQLVADAYRSVSTAARSVMGLPAVDVAPGSAADLLAIRGRSLADAIADASEERMVFKGGRLIAHTAVTSVLAPAVG